MNKVVLPPLPTIRDWPHSHEELRARDLEVARVVLEAAANRAATEDVAETDDPMGVQQCIVFAIRALEFHHAE